MQEGSPTIVTSPTESDAAFAATNLITAFDKRQASSQFGPLSPTGTEEPPATAGVCFKTDGTNLQSDGHNYVLGVGFNKSYFINAILVVQDIENWSVYTAENRLKNFDIWIGEDSSIYSANTKCANGPFNAVTSTDSFDDESNWNFGQEIWCNLQGQYVFLVASFSDVSSSAYTISLCNLGVFGTEY